jgi:hypothetical protein
MAKTKGRLVPPTPDAPYKPTATAALTRVVSPAASIVPHPFIRVNRSARQDALEPRAATGTLPLDFHNSSGDEDPSAAIPGRNYSRVPLELALDATLGGWNSHARATTRQALHDYLRRRRGARKEPKQ